MLYCYDMYLGLLKLPYTSTHLNQKCVLRTTCVKQFSLSTKTFTTFGRIIFCLCDAYIIKCVGRKSWYTLSSFIVFCYIKISVNSLTSKPFRPLTAMYSYYVAVRLQCCALTQVTLMRNAPHDT